MIKAITKKLINHFGYDIVSKHYQNELPHYLQLFDKESVINKRFYNISAGGHFGFGGGFYHPFWTNIDYFSPSPEKAALNPNSEIAHDLLSLEPLPLDSNSAELVQTQYTIEHLTDAAVIVLFKEVHRILKKKGVFRVVVPNFELDYVAFNNNDRHYFHWIEMFSDPKIYPRIPINIPLNQASLEQVFLLHFAANASTIHSDGALKRIADDEFVSIIRHNTFEDALNICVNKCSVEKQKLYRQNHINWWSNNKLKRMLSNAGFETIYKLSCFQSTSPVMRNNYYFDRYWNNVALFIEAVK